MSLSKSPRLYGKLVLRRLSCRAVLQAIAIVSGFWTLSRFEYTENGSKKGLRSGGFQDELVSKARKDAACITPKGATGYVVCTRLPYTEIKCGEFAKPQKVSDQFGRRYHVPDVIHFIWFGPVFNISQYYQYLALRSVASIQRPRKIVLHYNSDEAESNEIWNRITWEIPCIEKVRREAPERLFDIQIPEDLFKADVARLQILKEQGGIYLDLDVITLKPLDPLRIHSASVGRSVINKISNGIIFSERDSDFINIWLRKYQTYDPTQARSLAYWGLNVPYSICSEARGSGIVHLEETSFNRPNPYLDGLDSTLSAHIDITDNYFLHIHPKAAKNTDFDIHLERWDDDRLRTLDSVYGQAARVALFGSEDLVYFSDENWQEPWPKRRIFPFPEEGADPL